MTRRLRGRRRGLAWPPAAMLASLLTACSSSSSSGPPPSSDAGDSGFTTDAPPQDAARETAVDAPPDVVRDSGGDTAQPVDSGVDAGSCDRPMGGLPCDPNSIFCNGAPCDTTASYCCVMGNMPNSPQACVSDGTSCNGNSLHCDEATDCPGGQICCFVATSATSGDTQCMTQCSGGFLGVNFQICRTNSECGASGPCIVQTCSGVQVEACGMVTGCM